MVWLDILHVINIYGLYNSVVTVLRRSQIERKT
jgi:hypothetical protein